MMLKNVKTTPIAILFASLLMLAPAGAQAAQELSGAGDIVINVQDELGNPILGATVQVTVPNGDGALDDGSDLILTRTDGTNDPDGVNGGGGDGDVELAYNSSPVQFNSSTIADGDPFRITVNATGFAEYQADLTFSTSAANVVSSSNKYTVKIIVKDQAPFSAALSGALAVVSGGSTVTDGGVGDADATSDGVIYIAQDPSALGAGPHTVTASLNGYLETNNAFQTISSNAQTVYSFSMQYPFVLSAKDELGTTVALTTGATITGLTEIAKKANSNLLYVAASGGPAQITLAEPGYVASITTAGPYSYNSVGSQTTVQFRSGGEGPALTFAYKITSITTQAFGTDITGLAAGLAVGDDTGANACTLSGGAWYCPVSLANSDGTLQGAVTMDGYVESGVNLTAGTTRTVDSDAQVVDTIAGVLYAQVYEFDLEAFGTAHTGATVTISGGTGSCTEDGATGVYYCTYTTATDGGGISNALAGYVDDSATNISTDRSLKADPQDAATFTVKFAQKYTLTNEAFGSAHTGATVSLSGGDGTCAEDGVTGVYYCDNSIGADGGAISNSLAGYVDDSGTNASTDRTAQTDAQDAQSLTIKYAQKYTLTNEAFGTAHTGATVSLSGGDGTCTEYNSTGIYYCDNSIGADGGAISNSLAGYVDDSGTNASANRAAQTDTQDAQSFTIKYAQKYTLANEAFGTAHTGATVTISGGTGSCAEDGSTGVYYCTYSIGTDGGAISNSLAGYVDDSGTNASANRAAQTDIQDAQSLTIKYAQKYTLTTEETGAAAHTGATVTINGGTGSCAEDGVTGIYYCTYTIGTDSGAISNVLDGYVDDSATNTSTDRTAQTDAQDAQALTIKYSHKVTTISTETIGANIATSVTALSIGGDACTYDGVLTTWFCPVALANDDASSAASVTLDGYVEQAYGAVANRTAVTDAQSTDTISGVLYAQRYTLTNEAFGTAHTGATVTISGGTGSCTEDGATGIYFCTYTTGTDGGAISNSLAGYVDDQGANASTDRAANSDAQDNQSLTIKYAQKYTLTNEAFGTAHTGSAVTVVGGTGSCAENGSTGVYYCTYTFGTDGGAISNALDGYVDDQGTNTSTNRAAQTTAQDAQSLTIKYSHKISTVSTETIAANIAASLTALSIGGDACAYDGGTSAWYCPTLLANDTAGTATPTLDGYVEAAYGAVGDRTANTDAQSADTITGVQYAQKYTLTTEAIGAANTGATVTVSGGTGSCTEDGATGVYFCTYTIGTDGGAISNALDGYVDDQAANTSVNRAANSDAQDTQALTVKYSHKVTTISTETLAANIATSTTALSIGGDACTYDGGTTAWYCPVALANDNTATSATVTLDGYVEQAYGAVANRSANTDAQSTDTISGVLYAQKYTLTNEAFGTAHTGSTVTLVGGTGSCAENGATGVYYCTYTIATDGGGISNALAGYVDDQGANASTNRAANTDGQDAQSLTVKYAQKYTLTDQVFNTPHTGAAVSVVGGTGSCSENGATGVYYCTYTFGTDGGGISNVLDGYVDAQGTNTSANRAAQTAAQDAQSLAIQYGHIITSVTTETLLTNIATSVTTISIGGDSCAYDSGTTTWYCAVGLANDNTATSATVTLDGYVSAAYGTVNNRTADTDAQQTDAITGVQYAQKYTLTNEAFATAHTGASVTIVGGSGSCAENGATGVYYCNYTIATDGAAISNVLDGYVDGRATNTSANRSAHSSTQDAQAISVKYGHKVTTISTEFTATNIAGAGTALTIGGDACTWDAGSSAYYCAVLLANDDVSASAAVTLDGYVQGSYGTVGNRASHTAAQSVDAISGVQYAQKYTLVNEGFGTAHTGAVVSIVGGTGSCSEDGSTGIYYCDYTIGTDGGGISNVLDGYVDDQATNSSNNRTANTDIQDAQTVTVKYGHKITSVTTETLSADITSTVTSITIGGDSCSWNSGTSTWYCPVALANDNSATSATVTLDGYVAQAYGTVANRAAHTTAQQTDSITGVVYAQKYTLTNEAFGTAHTGATVTLVGGSGSCTEDGATGVYYCSYTIGADGGGISNVLSGYVDGQGTNTSVNRAANSTAQDAQSLTVKYSHKVTTIATETLAANIAGAGTTLTIGGDACTWDAGTSAYYCTVALANDDASTGATVTLDGYVATGYGTVVNRTANSDAQQTDAISGVQYAQKYTLTNEAFGTAHSGATVTVVGGTGSCTESGVTGVYYCNYTIATDGGGISNALDGYVDDQAANASSNRTANSSVQDAQSITVKYAQKYTLTNEAFATAHTGAAVTVVGSTGSCTENGATGVYYCTYSTADDGGGISNVLSGYVDDQGTNTSANRAGNTAAQDAQSLTIKYAHKVTTVSTETIGANIATSLTSLSIGGDSCSYDSGTATWYCPVALANDDAGTATPTLDGYVQAALGTVADRTLDTDGQSTDTITPVQYAQKYTLTNEAFGSAHTGATVTINSGTGSCTEDGVTGVYYCTYTFGTDGGSIANILDGYVNDQGTNSSTDRAAITTAQDAQSFTISYAHKVTSILTEALAADITSSVTALSIGGDACTWDGGTTAWYCPVALANDDTATSATVTLAGYVEQGYGAVGNRSASTDAQQVDPIADVLYGQKFTLTNEAFNTAHSGAAVSITGGDGTCAEDGVTGIYYCDNTPGNDAGPISNVLDGYVDGQATNAAAGRALDADAQEAQSLTIQYSHMVTTISTETVAANLAGSGTTLTIGGDSCAWDSGTSAYYCAVLKANDNSATSATVTLDGYVEQAYGTVADRTLDADAQSADTISGVQYSHIVNTINTEVLSTNIAAGATALSIGATACTYDGGTTTWYCPATLGDDDTAAGATVTLDGYVEKAYGAVADRTANSDGQQTDTISSVEYSHTVASIATEALAADITGSVTALSIGGDACAYDGGTTTWYCPVALANDDTAAGATVTLAGYVEQAYGTVANRTANSDAQQADSIADVLYGQKYTLTKEAFNTAHTGAAVSVWAGDGTCTEYGVTGIYYCDNTPGNDAGAISNVLDGYVDGQGSNAGNTRATDASAQDAQSLTIQYSHKVTTIGTETIAANLAGSGTTLTIGGDACTWDSGTSAYYCAVLKANDNTATSATVTLDGYVEQAYGTVGDRTLDTSAQSTDAISGVQYSHIVTAINTETIGTNIASSVTTLNIGGTSCTWNAGASTWFCPVPLANDSAATSATVTLDGYVEQAYGAVADRAANSDAQQTDTIANVQYSHIVTSIATELSPAVNIEGAGTTLTIGGDPCTWNAGAATYFCAVQLASDNSSTGASVVLDGYVTAGYGTVSNRAANSDAQVTDSVTGVQYSHKITVQREQDSTVLTGAAVTAGASVVACLEDTPNTTGEYYCPVVLADDGGASDISVALTGYVDGTDSTNDRTASSDAQQTYTETLLFRLRATVADEFATALNGSTITYNSVSPVASGGAYYFAQEGPGAVAASLDGYLDLDTTADADLANLDLTNGNGGNTGQTTVDLAGTTACAAGGIAGGAALTCNGLKFNSQFTINDNTSAGVTGLTAANFAFRDFGAGTVSPLDFSELGGGVYSIALPTTAAVYDIIDVDAGPDPKYQDYTGLSLGALSSVALNVFTPPDLMIAGDYLLLTATDGAMATTGSEDITIELYDSSGALLSTGSHATYTVTITLTGGSTSPASTKDIVSTTLNNATDVSGSGDLTVTGELTAGAATITISDNVVGDGADVLVSVSGAPALPQLSASDTSNLAIDVQPNGAAKAVIMDPTDDTVSANVAVTIEIWDAYDNIIPSNADRFTVTVDGNASIVSASQGTINSGAGSQSADVTAASGTVVLNVTDQIAETINIALSDSQGYGYDFTSSSQDLAFAPDVAAALVLLGPGQAYADALTGKTGTTTTQVAGVAFAIEGLAIDQFDNIATSAADTVSLASNDANNETVMPADFILSSGTATASVTLTKAQTTQLSLTSTTNPSFTAATENIVVIANSNDLDLQAATPLAGTQTVDTVQYVTYKNSDGLMVLSYRDTSTEAIQPVNSGMDEVNIEATVYDVYKNPVSGMDVHLTGANLNKLSIDGAPAGAASASGTTDINGQVSFVLTSEEVGTFALAVRTSSDTGEQIGVNSFNVIFKYWDILPPVIENLTPSEGASFTDADFPIIIKGEVSDPEEHFDELGVYYAVGADPTNIKLIGSQTATGAFSISWTPSELSGDYSVLVSATDTFNHNSTEVIHVTLDASVTIEGTLTHNQWHMVSAPIKPDNSNPDAMFDRTFGTDYLIYRIDPQAAADPDLGQNVRLTSVGQGYGFWIKGNQTDIEYEYTGSQDTSKNVSLDVKAGWNQIGSPFNRDFDIGAISIVRLAGLGDTVDWATAVSMGIVQSAAWGYDPSTADFTPVKDNTTGVSDTMAVKSGYALHVYEDVKLVFSSGAGLPGGVMKLADASAQKVVRPYLDFNLKLSAAAGGVADSYNMLGVRPGSANEWDPTDLQEPPKAPGGDYVRLYFDNADWSEKAAKYAADYREAPAIGASQEWGFNIETNEAGKTVTVTWDNSGLPTSTYDFILTNLDNGETVNMAEQTSYSYTASAEAVSTASFKITVTRKTAGQTLVSFAAPAGWSLIGVPVNPEAPEALNTLADQLGVVSLYQYKDGAFAAAESGAVNIQAGRGYWAHVDEATEIEIAGVAVDQTTGVDVGLTAGWNAVGNPFHVDLTWGDNITIASGGETKTLSEALAAGWLGSGLLGYDPQAGYVEIGLNDSLAPWAGCFIKANRDATLRFAH